FDSARAYFGKTELPLKYNVRISYYGGIQAHERVIEQALDLSVHKGLVYVDHKDMDDLVKQLETLARESREIRNAADNISATLKRGILINNPSITVTRLEPGMSTWREALLAKASEFESLWLVAYKEDRSKGFNLDRLQAHALLIGDQLLALLANRPDNTHSDLSSGASAISEHLYELGQIRFYSDGGTSLRAFNDLGDTVIQDIQRMKEQSLEAT
ncbi:MAG: hypothetical protein HY709_07310, partial [Candidatus Latescibacteria bacterium]|nr:hypothetical protein [Candidatus Latescibacterota bacterium]